MSKELAKTYDPKAIEEKLYEKWCENKYFHAEVDRSRKPFTTVMRLRTSQENSTWGMPLITRCRTS